MGWGKKWKFRQFIYSPRNYGWRGPRYDLFITVSATNSVRHVVVIIGKRAGKIHCTVVGKRHRVSSASRESEAGKFAGGGWTRASKPITNAKSGVFLAERRPLWLKAAEIPGAFNCYLLVAKCCRWLHMGRTKCRHKDGRRSRREQDHRNHGECKRICSAGAIKHAGGEPANDQRNQIGRAHV